MVQSNVFHLKRGGQFCHGRENQSTKGKLHNFVKWTDKLYAQVGIKLNLGNECYCEPGF